MADTDQLDPIYVKDCNVLIIGGGTSTLDVKWENLPFDRIWTCNDFFLEDRVLQQRLDLYLLAYTTDLSDDRLKSALDEQDPYVIVEPTHYRGKEHTEEFKNFYYNVGGTFLGQDLPNILPKDHPGSKSGAMFRLIQLALALEAKGVWFTGFDGFNKEFSNQHAFTKHVGLKDTDTRRDWDGTELSYVNVFTEAYKALTRYPNHSVLQNLGEGKDYNLGTPISQEYFPLRQELKDLL